MSTMLMLLCTAGTVAYVMQERDAAGVTPPQDPAEFAPAVTSRDVERAETTESSDEAQSERVAIASNAPQLELVDGSRPRVREAEVDCTPILESGYRRGRRAPVTVVRIDGKPIERATANAYLAMREAAAADGIELDIYSAFRSHAQQEYFHACYRTCSCNSCSPAAKPGFSNHQMGRAVDIGMWPGVHAWLVTNAKRFGFVATVKREPWHWELRKGAKGPRTPACPPE